jgi:drug/metabolite transporter (DMT)-like permease
MKQEQKALLFALAAVLLWSTVATAFKIALQYNGVLPLLTGASVTSLLCISAALAVQGKFIGAAKTVGAHWKTTVMLGAINPIIYYLVLFEAYDRLPAQVAQPVNYTWAITLALLSVPILKHSLTRFDVMGLILGYSGVVVISIAGAKVTGSLDMIGLALAIFSTLLWAGFWLLNTKSKQDPLVQLFHNFLFATPALVLLTVVFNQPIAFTWPSVLSLAYVGLFEMGITFIFWQTALHLTSHAARIGTLIFLSPFISLFLISFILKEPLQWQTFAGLGLIIGGVIVSQRKR